MSNFIKFFFSSMLALVFIQVSIPCRAQVQNISSIRIDEYYWGTPLKSVLKDFKNKYKINVVYDSLMVEGYTFDFLFSNTSAKSAIDILFRDNKSLSYFYDEDSVVHVIPRVAEPDDDYSEEDNNNIKRNSAPVIYTKYSGGAQKYGITVSGIIRDHNTGEPLPYASIIVKETKTGASSNIDGYFTLFNVPSDTSAIIVSYIGYQLQTFYLSPTSALNTITIELETSGTEIKGVVVEGERERLMRTTQDVSSIKMSPIKVADLPNMGEKDIFRSFQLMPGISGSNESSAGLYVRGGTPDQNLILYDGFTIYHQEHLYGVFSAFNSNAVKDVQLHKGGYEAKYGGKLSSVMEIIGKTGNDRKFNIGADVSFLGFNAYTEIPLKKKGSIFIAGRRSYKTFLYKKIFNAFNKNAAEKIMETTNYGPGGKNFTTTDPSSFFYDINAKFTYNITKKDLISLSFFNGEDVLDNTRDFDRSAFNVSIAGETTDITKWGNWGGSAKWSRKWNENFYSNTLVSYSKYFSKRERSNNRDIDINGTSTEFKDGTNEKNDLNDISLKMDNEYKFNSNNQLEFGLQYSNYNISYSYIQNDTIPMLNMKNYGNIASVYAQDRMKFFNKLSVLPGVRLTYFDVCNKLYFEPRIQANYEIIKNLKLKTAWGIYYQFVNRIVREDIMSGSRDIWILSNNTNLPVGKATHYILGASYDYKDFLFDVEAYYKDLKGLSEYTLRFTPQFGQEINYSELFYQGEGYTRGIEFLLQKKSGRYSGWVGYTLSETRYHFPVYGDDYFSASQDVTHEIKIINTYKLKKHFTFSATWIFATGKPYTEPLGGYTLNMLDGNTSSFILAGSKNSARYPAYHRLDVMAKYDFFIWGSKGAITLSVFNLYNHKNVWYKEFEIDETGLTETNVNFLGITPNLTLTYQLR